MMPRLVPVVLLVFGMNAAVISQTTAQRAPRNAAELDELFQRVSNWGRWGKDDQLGSVNLVTAAKRRQATALVKDGISVSLAHNPLTERAEDNRNPFEHTMSTPTPQPPWLGLGDTYRVQYHGFAHSHIDALCHIMYKDRAFNGYARADVETPRGCIKLGIENLKNGIITRGILLDIPRLKNLPYLEPGTPIYVEDLEAWEAKAGLKINAGDAIFLRTGRWARRDKLGPWNLVEGEAGIHASVAPWIKTRGVALIGSDSGLDVLPSGVDGVTLPVHVLMITALGINILDNHDLEALAATAAKLNRWEFMLTVSPLPVTGGTGSPVNALAMF